MFPKINFIKWLQEPTLIKRGKAVAKYAKTVCIHSHLTLTTKIQVKRVNARLDLMLAAVTHRFAMDARLVQRVHYYYYYFPLSVSFFYLIVLILRS